MLRFIEEACKTQNTEDDCKIEEEGLRMFSFLSNSKDTHSIILNSRVLDIVFSTIKPGEDEQSSCYAQLMAMIILHLGLNEAMHQKIIEPNLAIIIRELAKRDNYFVQMDILTVLKILLTSNNDKIRDLAVKASFLETVIATSISSKYKNVCTICGFILQYY